MASGFSSLAGTQRNMNINKNSTNANTNVIAADVTTNVSSGVLAPTAVTKLAAGDVIRVFLYQDSGGNATHSGTEFSIDYLRPANI
jgi:hypothetical protein